MTNTTTGFVIKNKYGQEVTPHIFSTMEEAKTYIAMHPLVEVHIDPISGMKLNNGNIGRMLTEEISHNVKF